VNIGRFTNTGQSVRAMNVAALLHSGLFSIAQ
jgi:hypothetical protein